MYASKGLHVLLISYADNAAQACTAKHAARPLGAWVSLTGVEHLAVGSQLPGNDAACANAGLAAGVDQSEHDKQHHRSY